MEIDVTDIQRVIEDFDSKAAYYHRSAEKLYNQKDFVTSAKVDAKSHAYEYCSMVLRGVLTRENHHTRQTSTSRTHDTAI